MAGDTRDHDTLTALRAEGVLLVEALIMQDHVHARQSAQRIASLAALGDRADLLTRAQVILLYLGADGSAPTPGVDQLVFDLSDTLEALAQA